MSILSRLLNPVQHCDAAAAYLLSALKVKFTRSHLQHALLEHPDYPSLMSIADVLGIEYNVSTAPLKMKWEDILAEPGISAPFIAHIKAPDGTPMFATVTKYSAASVEFITPVSERTQTYTGDQFSQAFTGTILLAVAEEHAAEHHYHQNRTAERRNEIVSQLIVWSLPVLTVLSILLGMVVGAGEAFIAPAIFALVTMAGSLLGALLILQELDQFNPVLKQVCQKGASLNCTAVMNSKAAKVFGISLSSIGATYFIGMLLVLLTGGVYDPGVLQVLSWVNVLALPVVLFSVYYQWKVVKQWCVLCLLFMLLLVLQFVTALGGKFHMLTTLDASLYKVMASVLAGFTFVFVAVQLLVPALKKAKTSSSKTTELQRMKHNPQIFEAMLGRQKSISMPPPEMGISMGNPDGVFRLIKVCNPYCGPCATAHPKIDELLDSNPELSLQMIFNATAEANDHRKMPVAHLMAIDAANDKTLTRKALDSWYNAPVKVYKDFAAEFPMNGELSRQDAAITQMRDWCNTVDIQFTPTFFLCVNTAEENAVYYQLPEMYSVSDLKYFLTV